MLQSRNAALDFASKNFTALNDWSNQLLVSLPRILLAFKSILKSIVLLPKEAFNFWRELQRHVPAWLQMSSRHACVLQGFMLMVIPLHVCPKYNG